MRLKQIGADILWAKGISVYFYSCYSSPNATLAQYTEILDSLMLDARDHSPKVIAGDFTRLPFSTLETEQATVECATGVENLDSWLVH